VSVDGKTYPLHKPFMVVATQNPMGFEGTYPLPENQLDRFLMRITLGYPTAEAEERLLDLRPASTVLDGLNSNTDTQTVVLMQESVDRVHLSPALRAYIVALARATRESPEFRVGISPRGSLALAQAARAWAWMQSRDHVIPEDVLTLLGPVCAHRTVSADPRAQSDHDRAAELLAEVTRSVPAPV
jgi:MoxR-like ATPase